MAYSFEHILSHTAQNKHTQIPCTTV